METAEKLQNNADAWIPLLALLRTFSHREENRAFCLRLQKQYIYLQEELVTGRNGTDLKAKEKHELTDAPKERKSITHTRENKQNRSICQEYCSTYNAYYNTYRKTICLFFYFGCFLV